MERILVTGGAGYIGSHTCVELLQAGYDVVAVDDLTNSKEEAIRRVRALTGKDFPFFRANVCDEAALNAILGEYPVNAAIHFAGLKAVGESVEKPLAYYRNNLNATMTLLACMRAHGVGRIIFSSSATVYGTSQAVPLNEDTPTGCTNPYGWTKYMSEQIIRDCVHAAPAMSAVLLRYFNPVGAHESGRIGEDPQGVPNNLMPYIAKVAAGEYPYLRVYGDDYDTPDGTGVRDYIHVVDLAKGHLAALRYSGAHTGSVEINLGTGKGHSVLELVKTYEEVSGTPIPYKIEGRRSGDIAVCYADTAKAKALLGWQAEKSLADMCASTCNWIRQNPRGYGDD